MMIPDAYLSHQSFRRARIKVPSKRGDEGYFARISDSFKGYEGIETVTGNPVTGSILFNHSADFRAIREYAEKRELFTLKLNASPPRFNSGLKKRFLTLDDRVKVLTGKEIDIPGIAFLTLMGLGVSQITAGTAQALPWHAAFWYALNIFLMRRPPAQ